MAIVWGVLRRSDTYIPLVLVFSIHETKQTTHIVNKIGNVNRKRVRNSCSKLFLTIKIHFSKNDWIELNIELGQSVTL